MSDALFVAFCLTAAAGLALVSIPLALIVVGIVGAVLAYLYNEGAQP